MSGKHRERVYLRSCQTGREREREREYLSSSCYEEEKEKERKKERKNDCVSLPKIVCSCVSLGRERKRADRTGRFKVQRIWALFLLKDLSVFRGTNF